MTIIQEFFSTSTMCPVSDCWASYRVDGNGNRYCIHCGEDHEAPDEDER